MSQVPVSQLLEDLGALEELIANHGYTAHADYIHETVDAFRVSGDVGWDRLASVDFWGGSGSIADISFSQHDIERYRHVEGPVRDYLSALGLGGYANDTRHHWALLTRISAAMKSCPVTPERQRWIERANSWSTIFTGWLNNPGTH